MLNRTALLVALCAFALVTRATSAAEPAKLSSKDMKFVNDAAAGGTVEVALGKLAADKASSDDVKKFGQMMVDDHSKANDELKSIATTKGVDLMKAMDKGTKKSEKESEKLSKLSGAEFDKEYIAKMVKDHEKDANEFEHASKDAEDSDVKAFAAKTLPTIQHHLDVAKELHGKLK